jgi:hypothetical protein
MGFFSRKSRLIDVPSSEKFKTNRYWFKYDLLKQYSVFWRALINDKFRDLLCERFVKCVNEGNVNFEFSHTIPNKSSLDSSYVIGRLKDDVNEILSSVITYTLKPKGYIIDDLYMNIYEITQIGECIPTRSSYYCIYITFTIKTN